MLEHNYKLKLDFHIFSLCRVNKINYSFTKTEPCCVFYKHKANQDITLECLFLYIKTESDYFTNLHEIGHALTHNVNGFHSFDRYMQNEIVEWDIARKLSIIPTSTEIDNFITNCLLLHENYAKIKYWS